MRGGLGQDVSFGVIDGQNGPLDQVTIGVRGGRHDFPVPGICGGGDASPARILLNGENIRSGRQYHLRAGDRLDFSISGGGGYGDPTNRHRSKIEEDVRLGYVSAEQALSVYGWTPRGDGGDGSSCDAACKEPMLGMTGNLSSKS
jgi:N-methylhydantoinase B